MSETIREPTALEALLALIKTRGGTLSYEPDVKAFRIRCRIKLDDEKVLGADRYISEFQLGNSRDIDWLLKYEIDKLDRKFEEELARPVESPTAD